MIRKWAQEKACSEARVELVTVCLHIPLSHEADVIAGWKTNLLGDCSDSSRERRVLSGEEAQA